MEINKITTKYQIGDRVYFLHRNEIRSGIIYLIDVNLTIFNGGTIRDIYYKIADKDCKLIGEFAEELLYESKTKLIHG